MPNPGAYSGAVKSIKDLLNRNYVLDTRKVQIKTKTNDGVGLTMDGQMQTFGKNAVLCAMSGKYAASAGVSLDKLAVSTHGRFDLEGSISDITDGLSVNVKASDGKPGNGLGSPEKAGRAYEDAAEVGLTYETDACTVEASVDILNEISVKTSCLGTYESALLGANFEGSNGKDGFAASEYGGLVGYKADDFTVALQASKKCSVFGVHVFHKINSDCKVGAIALYTKEADKKDKEGKVVKDSSDKVVKTPAKYDLSFGGSYRWAADTTVEARVNQKWEVAANVQQKLNDSLSMTVASQINGVDLGGDKHKFGMSFTFSN